MASTSGAKAYGISANSVGGAGGSGGGAFLVGDAGNGGAGGAAENVSVTTTDRGAITTVGDQAHGIFALSQGGVGGKGGDIDLSLGGGGGTGGNGGEPHNVTVNNTVGIDTTGVGAAGIWAQSAGAKGGDGGGAALCFLCAGGSGAAASSGGTVTVQNNSAITTQLDGGVGIFAQCDAVDLQGQAAARSASSRLAVTVRAPATAARSPSRRTVVRSRPAVWDQPPYLPNQSAAAEAPVA